MNLGEYIAYQLLEVELSGDIKHIVALYPGRFQPMGTHHAKTYNWVQSKFGDAWVVTSDKVQLPKSPLNFNEKKKIINKHGIRKVAKVKNPYQAVEVLSKYDPKTTAAVFIVGKKDQERLGGKFFRPWQGVAEVGYRDGAYTMIAPHISLNIPGVGEMSGTTIRQALSQPPDTPESKRLFKGIMGWYDTGIHKMISGKLMVNDIIEKFINNSDFTDALHEASVTSISQAGDVDDGPQSWYKNQSNYKSATQHIAQKLGMKVLNYLSGDDDFEAELTRYQHITRSPSTFPAGAQGKTTTINQDNLSTKAAYKVWRNYIQNIATSVGMQFLDYLGAEYSVNVDEPNTELDGLLGEGLLVETPDEDVGKVQCMVCGCMMKQIQYRHLKYSHNGMTMPEYKDKYPNAPLILDSAKNTGNKNPMANPIVRETHKKSVTTAEYRETQRIGSTGRIASDETKKKMSENNAMHSSENRKKVSDGVRKAYEKDPLLREKRSVTGKKYGFGNSKTQDKIAEVRGSKRGDERDEFERYQELVRRLSNENYQTYFKEIPNAKKRSRDYHLDHKFSISEGFRRNIPVEIISHYSNFEIMHGRLNESKGTKSSISLRELIFDIESSNHPIGPRNIKQLLTCGGAAGHMSHPFDDNNLTFGDIKDIIRLSLQGNLSMEKVATEKCISGDSILFLEKLGPTKIKDVVDGNLDDSVLAYNSQDDKNEYLPIVHKFNNGPADEWIVIELEDGKEIKVTPNHKIFVEGKGFVRADELTEDDELKIV